MARRRLTPEEEHALAKAAEERATGDEEWDFARAKPENRGRNPTVVLSGRVPVVYAQMLRRMAIARRCSISDLVKQALEDYAVAAPQVSYTRPRHMMLRVAYTGGSETMNVKADERSIDKTPSTETSAA
jgi:hypothetical protein